jgi:hypothetical protein
MNTVKLAQTVNPFPHAKQRLPLQYRYRLTKTVFVIGHSCSRREHGLGPALSRNKHTNSQTR